MAQKLETLISAIAKEQEKKRPSSVKLTELYKEEVQQAAIHLDLRLTRQQTLSLERQDWLRSLQRWQAVVVRRAVLNDFGAFHRIVRVSTTGNFLLTNDCWYSSDGVQNTDQPFERLTWMEPFEGMPQGDVWGSRCIAIQRSLYSCAMHRHYNETLALLVAMDPDDIARSIMIQRQRDFPTCLWILNLLWSKPQLEAKAWKALWFSYENLGLRELQALSATVSAIADALPLEGKDKDSYLRHLRQFFS